MSTSSGNTVVSLEVESLYIATSQIVADPGKFHWSFYLTDSAGIATQHQWTELRSDANKRYCEGYLSSIVDPVTTYSSNFQGTFAFFKVRGFRFSGQQAFARVASQAFSEDRWLGFASVKKNRDAGLSCRTWVMSILGRLKTEGYLEREETPEWFEEQVKRASIAAEDAVMRAGGLEKSAVQHSVCYL
ncbi:hypothetical protein BV25DRAFT_762446 [Artomyces pyxidatus]|uniref:Uncharacterized protein n=1 Tax=Artomyces pyxidatus TaxID=48021 RepID=A0ACB8T047_9AGAM|nr:hypothetical protein BV25DRAFT_762446 [Artomyces pyxidatus]